MKYRLLSVLIMVILFTSIPIIVDYATIKFSSPDRYIQFNDFRITEIIDNQMFLLIDRTAYTTVQADYQKLIFVDENSSRIIIDYETANVIIGEGEKTYIAQFEYYFEPGTYYWQHSYTLNLEYGLKKHIVIVTEPYIYQS